MIRYHTRHGTARRKIWQVMTEHLALPVADEFIEQLVDVFLRCSVFRALELVDQAA